MRIDDLDAPPGVFGVRAFPYVTTVGPLRHLAGLSRAVAALAGRQSAFVGSILPAPLSPFRTCTFPVAAGVMLPCAFPVQDTAADALPVLPSRIGDISDSAEGSQAPPRSSLGTAAVGGDPQTSLEGPSSPPPTSTSRARPTRLDPSDLISTRTRRRRAAAAGTPQPDVNYGFSPNLHIPPFARSASLERMAGPAPTVPVTPSSPLSPSAAPLSPTAACTPRPTSQIVPAAPSVAALVRSAAESRVRDAVGSFRVTIGHANNSLSFSATRVSAMSSSAVSPRSLLISLMTFRRIGVRLLQTLRS